MVFLSSSQNANQVHQQVPRWKESSELRILSWNIYMLPYISLFNNARISLKTNIGCF